MKSLKLIAVFIGLSFFAYGQDCKYDSQKKEAATGAMQKAIVVPVRGSGASETQVMLLSKDKGYFFELTFSVLGKDDTVIRPGEKLSVILEDNQVITLVSKETYQPKFQTEGYFTFSTYKPVYSITEADLKKMEKLNSRVIEFRLGTVAMSIDVERNVGKLKEGAACIRK